ncbi:zinc-binding dehydrogenase [Pimelobacter simplex]|uniref:Threonine dehydrogenase-related Zn-dependent dehydrogenase n=1 Tax=Nocardioides simplex TaxID=2045 RepID=A0A0A1DLP8_NOCSI|nr:zinc-dependent alcohol dehydrogenase family protein [Pimelobacter simplex]AIY17517.1 Threonine dehydrogenase-related Zn-dependent dehydrogenase [Pimelobacter simplex]MCG8149902.1 zinc-binding dehydrogenase [Pimelobacter simplex]GEB13890.1 IMP dehydrogenase [Pimelobacter simplex]SFM66857.1 alcohol dehydrogenase [Pimelobacter simplex]
MRATTIHAARDIRVEEVPDPQLKRPTDAIVKVTAGCICGSDLWPYRGENPIRPGATIGHECIGVVEEVGAEVRDFKAGDYVIVPFCHCDNTCAHCRNGAQSACVNLSMTSSGQAEYARVGQADGSLVATGGTPSDDLLASVLALTDVMPTGWHAAVCAGVTPGATAVVVGDGAVGLCGVIAAKAMGAERIVAMSRHAPRQELARAFGATHVVAARGKDAVAEVLELTDGVGADAVLECVGTDDAMTTAIGVTRPGGGVGYVGVPHGVELPLRTMFERNLGLRGGIAPVRRYLPELLALVQDRSIDPGRVFDLSLPLEESPEGYRAMDERRAIKVMLRP